MEIYTNIIKFKGRLGDLSFKILQRDSKSSSYAFKTNYIMERNSLQMEAMIVRYNKLSEPESVYWKEIAKKHGFYSKYQAFASSFLLHAGRYGLTNALLGQINYIQQKKQSRKTPIFDYKETKKAKNSLETLKNEGYSLVYGFVIPKVESKQDIEKALKIGLILKGVVP